MAHSCLKSIEYHLHTGLDEWTGVGEVSPQYHRGALGAPGASQERAA